MSESRWLQRLLDRVALAVVLIFGLQMLPRVIARIDVWNETRLIWKVVEEEGSRVGPAGSPVEIIEFVDYQCPWCKALRGETERVAEEMGIGMIILHKPLERIHAASYAAARIAVCAQELGQFNQMHRLLLRDLAPDADMVQWASFAKAAGINDMDAFEECMASARPDRRVARDLGLAERLTVTGTPTFVGRNGSIGSLADVVR